MSSSFPQGGEKLDHVQWGLPSQASQSGQGGDRDSNTSASYQDQSDGGGTGFHDRSDVMDGKSSHHA